MNGADGPWSNSLQKKQSIEDVKGGELTATNGNNNSEHRN
jgi:hypothetical protein